MRHFWFRLLLFFIVETLSQVRLVGAQGTVDVAGLQPAPSPSIARAGSTNAAASQRRAAALRFLAQRSPDGRPGIHRAKHLSHSLNPHPIDSATVFNLTATWRPLGPARTVTAAYGAVTGRVTSIAVDPADTTGNIVYLGTTGGGVWKSVNAAASLAQINFTAITDDAPPSSAGVGSLSIGAVSVQPGETGVVLAGTGDPNDALDSYYGQGILRSSNNGLTWTAIDESRDNLYGTGPPHSFVGEGFTGFAWSTTNPNLVVGAVTQALDGVVVNALQANSFQGLYYSGDAGITWQLATITDGPGLKVQSPATNASVNYEAGYTGNGVTAVVWNTFRRMFYAAVQFHGYYSSPDGITWTRLTGQPGLGLSLTNCPTNPNQPGNALSCPLVRGALAVQPLTGDMFAFTVAPYNSLEQGNPDQGIWRDLCAAVGSTCSTGTANMFSAQLPVLPLENGAGAITQGDYDLWLAAVPATGGSADTLLYAGTEDIFKYSLLGGTTWQNLTNVNDCPVASIAPSQHAVAVGTAGGPLMFFGNDSGLWRSIDGIQKQSLCVSDLQNMNGALGSLAEVSAIAQDPLNSGTLLVSQGVSGTSGTNSASVTSAGTAWPQVLDGYGSYVAIDPGDSLKWYASAAGVDIYLCEMGPACLPADYPYLPLVGDAQTDTDGETLLNPAVWMLDPQDATQMIIGTCRVWRGSVAGSTADWSTVNALSPVLNEPEEPGCNGQGQISTLGASGAIVSSVGAPTTREVLYAGMYGTDRSGVAVGGGTVAGHVFTQVLDRSASGASAWIDISRYPSIVVNDTLNGGVFDPGGFTVSSVVVDTHDASGQTVYATIQGFSGNGVSEPTVYRSTNQGQSWMNVTANLPEVPVNGVVVDPGDANTVYLATDAGVFVTTSIAGCMVTGASCWSPFGTLLPDVPVTAIEAWGTGGAGLLRAGTYGRGVWQTALASAQPLTTISVQPSPAALAFSAQQEQSESPPQFVTITNTGSVALVVHGVQISEDAEGQRDFDETDTCSPALPVQASCMVTVQFHPTTTGPLNAILTIVGNLSGGQVQILLSGTGTAAGQVTLTPSSLTFPQPGVLPTLVGSTSAPQFLTINNAGSTPVTLGTPQAGSPFHLQGNTCTGSDPGQTSCTAGIVFVPTVNGPASGTFSIVAGTVTLTATLSGTGQTPPTDGLSGASNGQLQFAPQLVGTVSSTQTVVINNTGREALTLVSVSSTSSDFIVKAGCTTVPAQNTCAILVNFAPTVAGTRAGTLIISDVLHAGTTAQTLTMVGTGVARAGVPSVGPSSLDFGIEGLGSISAVETVTLTNNGTTPLTGLLFSSTGDFQAAPGSCGTFLAPGLACQPSITFTPSSDGPLTGVLTVSGSNQQFTTSLTGAGIDFNLGTAVGISPVDGASTETIVSGAKASYQVNIQPVGNSTGTLAIACSGAPAGYTCTANGGSIAGVVQLQSGQASAVTITIAPVATASIRRFQAVDLRNYSGSWPIGVLALGLIVPLWPRRKSGGRMSSALVVVLGVALVLGGLTGCAFTTKSTGGGAATGTGGTPGTADTLRLTVSAPGISRVATVPMIIEQ